MHAIKRLSCRTTKDEIREIRIVKISVSTQSLAKHSRAEIAALRKRSYSSAGPGWSGLPGNKVG
jgi:hypothetical protein